MPGVLTGGTPLQGLAHGGAISEESILSLRPEGNWDNKRLRTFHILNNRDFYMEVPSFNGTAGTGSGTAGGTTRYLY